MKKIERLRQKDRSMEGEGTERVTERQREGWGAMKDKRDIEQDMHIHRDRH